MDSASGEIDVSTRENVLSARAELKRLETFKGADVVFGANILSRITPRFGIKVDVFNQKYNVTSIKLTSFATVSDLKKSIAKKIQIDEPKQIRVFYHNSELKNPEKTLHQNGIRNKSKIFYIAQTRPQISLGRKKKTVRFFGCVPRNKESKLLLEEVSGGIKKGFKPELTMDGTGGGYFMRDKNKKYCAIFKPADEEPYAPNNPRIYRNEVGTQGFRPGLFSGTGASREVAAFLLDHNGFSGVPLTTLTELSQVPGFKGGQQGPTESKIGSLQRMAGATEMSSDYGTRRFDVQEVHKIGILDLHIVNLDRNEQNILVRTRGDSQLLDFFPIDHGYCLPTSLAVTRSDWVWASWPQTRKSFSDRSLEFINKINIEKEITTLQRLGIEDGAILVFRIMNTLLKKGAAADLTLSQIARIALRPNRKDPSRLETVVITAMASFYLFQNSFPAPTINRTKTKKSSSGNNSEPQTAKSSSDNNAKRPTSRSVATPGPMKLPENLEGEEEITKNKMANLKSTHFKLKNEGKRARRACSSMDLRYWKNCNNCFATLRALFVPRQREWRMSSEVDIPEKFGERLWLSRCAQLSNDFDFLGRIESLLDLVVKAERKKKF